MPLSCPGTALVVRYLHGTRGQFKLKALPGATCVCRASEQGYHFAAAVEMEVGEDGKRLFPS